MHGVPLSFQEFFQIRQTEFSFRIHFKVTLSPCKPYKGADCQSKEKKTDFLIQKPF